MIWINPTFILLYGFLPSRLEDLHFDKGLSPHFRPIVNFVIVRLCLQYQLPSMSIQYLSTNHLC
uniref:Uncharacterized protein n=1 Tax=Rhizophora mucronata TaxID=61149 RepID=A0A2P2M228_RHIMU